MDLQASKIELVKLILNIDNDKFIQMVTDFIKNENADFWHELSSSEQDEIKMGIEQLKEGKRKTYKDVLKNLE